MRPPSYYTSLANSNAMSNRSSNSSQQLRSSFSSSSSSSYVSRTHLPFVPQSTLVAHCFTGVGSSTRPYGQSGYSASKSYTTSYTSRPQSTKRYSQNPYLSPAAGSGSSGGAISRSSTYVSSSGQTSYSQPNFTSSTYYKPIRLRERPLLTQISRQLNSTPAPTSRSRPPIVNHQVHSSTRRRQADESEVKPAEEPKRRDSPPKTEQSKQQDEASWSSDVARNISRNKYLIKFREFDKRPSLAELDKPTEKETSATMRIPRQPVAELDGDRELCKDKREATDGVAGADCESQRPDCDTPVASKTAPISEKQAEDSVAEAKSSTKVPKEKRNIKLRLKAQVKSEQANGDAATTRLVRKKDKEPAEAPVGTSAANPDTPTKPKVKRIVKTSKSKAALEAKREKEAASAAAAAGDQKPGETSERKVLAPKQRKANETESRSAGDKQVATNATAAGAQFPPSGNNSPATVANKRIRFREYHIEDFNFLSVLGHGGWGFVILAELKDYDACFAVKCIKKITIVEDDDFDSIMIERKVLTLGNVHPFICKLFCTFETEGYLFFVMEYCAGGDLMFHVQREGKFTESRSRFYASEIICAIRYLHNRHIIYRDLKLDNILLDSKGHIRLVDFGMCQCRTYREEMLPSNFCGTPEYISPEIIRGVPYNHSVDWWSFGVLLYEMAVGKMPFRGNDENELLWNVCYEQIHYPMFLTKELTTLLQSLLEREPSKRMGMATCKAGDIYDQPWFRGVDWPAVEEMRVQPPFVPEVRSKRDVQNFDSDFTESAPELSPVEASTLERIDQSQFQKFPYTNPDIAIFE